MLFWTSSLPPIKYAICDIRELILDCNKRQKIYLHLYEYFRPQGRTKRWYFWSSSMFMLRCRSLSISSDWSLMRMTNRWERSKSSDSRFATILSCNVDVEILYLSPDSRFDPVCIFVDEKLDVSTHLHNLLHLPAVLHLCCIFSLTWWTLFQNVICSLAPLLHQLSKLVTFVNKARRLWRHNLKTYKTCLSDLFFRISKACGGRMS